MAFLMTRWITAIGVGCTVLALATLGPGQSSESGGVTGIVKDQSGAVVAGATLKVYSPETGVLERTVVTNAEGLYTVPSLRPGAYRVEATNLGFSTYTSSIAVRLSELERLDIILKIGEAQESISVQAVPTLVDTQNATTGQPLDNGTLIMLPLAEPNFLFLIGLSPGISAEPADVRKSGRATVDVSVNGQRTSNNSVSLEGINVTDVNLAHFDYLPVPDPEAIQEFKVSTSLYDASQGSKGGGALALVLKTGTQQFHGALYANIRNDAFNANEWFRAHDDQPRAKLIQNVFGGQAGGPFPGFKGFWYTNVQLIRGRNGIDTNGSTISPTIPALPMNADGSTSAALLASRFGLSASQIDPVAVNILNDKSNYYGGTFLIPRPGQPGCSGDVTPPTSPGYPATFNCNFSKASSPADSQFTLTYDRPLRHQTDNLRISAFYDNFEVNKPYGTAQQLAGPQNSIVDNRFISLSYTSQIGSRQVNELKFGFNRSVFSLTPRDILTLKDVGATRPNENLYPGIYDFTASTFSFGVSFDDDRGTANNIFQWGDSWSMTVGKHTIHAGGDIIRYQLNKYNNGGSRGGVDFFPFSDTSQPTNWLNFITGTVTNSYSGGGNSHRSFRALAADLYVQDDYRLSPRLTVNLGLRWEPMQFAHDLYYRNGNYSYQLAEAGRNPFVFPSGLNQDGVTGTPGVSDCTLRHCWDANNFGPRVGFAWDAFGDGKTVVRGGAGIYYQQLSNLIELQGSMSAPFKITQYYFNFDGKSLQLANPLANQPSGTSKVLPAYVPAITSFAGVSGDVNSADATVNWVNPSGQLCQISGGSATNCSIDLASYASADLGLHSPYTEQWNLTVQRQLGRNWALEAGYVGTHGLGGIALWDPIQARLASPANPVTVKDTSGRVYVITTNTLANVSLRQPALGLDTLAGAGFTSNIGNQIYHSLQVTLSHRLQAGLFFQLGYTFSKNIDNVSGGINTNEFAGQSGRGGAGVYNNQLDIAGNRAISDLDRPQRLTVSYVYDFPVPQRGMWRGQAFQGWSVSGLVTFQSGQPFTLFDLVGGAYGYAGGTVTAICNSNQIAAPPGDAPLATCVPGTPTNPLAALTSGSIEKRLDYYINPNFFSHPALVPYAGDTNATAFGSPNMRNIYRGPFQQACDFSILKTFRIGEKNTLLFRTDFFNLFNHPVFSIPAYSDFTGDLATFSNVTQTVIPARLIQFGLKYSF